jgi:hypothetical protein
MTFDLGDHNYESVTRLDRSVTDPIDDSGKPRPTQAYLITADGYRIAADIVYDGIDSEGDRRYALIVETDWLSLRLAACELDRCPADVKIQFKQPGNFNPEDRRKLTDVLRGIEWVVGGQTGHYQRRPNDGIRPVVKWVDR